MKANHYLIAATACLLSMTATSQQRVINLYSGGEVIQSFNVEQIDSLKVEWAAPESEFDIFENISFDEMVYVEGGTFTMGTNDSDADVDETPHTVTLSSFYIGKYEVTQKLWEYVMTYEGQAADGTTMTSVGDDPWLGKDPNASYGDGDYFPAYYVTYYDIVDYFLPRLNQITGKNFRLLTEAEWEYAARGGNQSQGYKFSGSDNVDDVAWYYDNAYDTTDNYGTHIVGTTQPNELGLYDMTGNVWEWCNDWYGAYDEKDLIDPQGPLTGGSRVNRGGGWDGVEWGCRVTLRSYSLPDKTTSSFGFRLAL